MQYFDWTGVWGINGRNGYSTFEYLCISAISLIGKTKMNNALLTQKSVFLICKKWIDLSLYSSYITNSVHVPRGLPYKSYSRLGCNLSVLFGIQRNTEIKKIHLMSK